MHDLALLILLLLPVNKVDGNLRFELKMLKKIFAYLTLISLLLFIVWYFFIALKPQPMLQSDVFSAYRYLKIDPPNMQLVELDKSNFEFTLVAFDGEKITGQIAYPDTLAKPYPVLLGVPAMGRSYVRWFNDSFKGRPTVTQVNKITQMAKDKGYVVISIDPRYHGKRKDPNRSLREIMNDLHFFGDKSDYQSMIRDTVVDYRVVMDWIELQTQFDSSKITVAGYSMGGQIALLLASIDQRITGVISIVPPFIDDKTALVAPINVVNMLTDQRVLLVTANDDENASVQQNERLYQSIGSQNKQHRVFDGGHILPDGYVSELTAYF